MKPTAQELKTRLAANYGLSLAEVDAILETPVHPAEMRDEFAIAALNSPQLFREGESVSYDEAARSAYQLADAMLEARNANR